MKLVFLRVAKKGLPAQTFDQLVARAQQLGRCDHLTGQHIDDMPYYYLRFDALEGILIGQVKGLIEQRLGLACQQMNGEQVIDEITAAASAPIRATASGPSRAAFDLIVLEMMDITAPADEDPNLTRARKSAMADATRRVGAGD